MNKKLFFTVIFLLLAGYAHASVRIDRSWVKARAHELCVPGNAAQAERNCQPEFNTCMAEFEELMDGQFFTFCRGTNPEICNTVGYDLYEFSNMGYGNQVVAVGDRFLFLNPTVKAAYACTAEKKSPEVSTQIGTLRDQFTQVNHSAAVSLVTARVFDKEAVMVGSYEVEPSGTVEPPARREEDRDRQAPAAEEVSDRGSQETEARPTENPGPPAKSVEPEAVISSGSSRNTSPTSDGDPGSATPAVEGCTLQAATSTSAWAGGVWAILLVIPALVGSCRKRKS